MLYLYTFAVGVLSVTQSPSVVTGLIVVDSPPKPVLRFLPTGVTKSVPDANIGRILPVELYRMRFDKDVNPANVSVIVGEAVGVVIVENPL
jgi:hypothetical protein